MCDIFENYCRICLDVESDHVSILEDPTVILHLKTCLAISVSSNDHLPKTICISCMSLLSQFYNFQLNARCSQDWLESSVQEKVKKNTENKMPLQPLPDSEYNSDSLLEFLNNTANIEEYLNNLGKEDIPCIVNMLDRNEHNLEEAKTLKATKIPSPKKKDNKKIKLDADITDLDFTVAKNVIKRDADIENKFTQIRTDKITCFGCKTNYDTIPKLLQHLSICDIALRTCIHCNMLFNSKQQMQEHSISHNTTLPLSCNCGEQFQSKEKLINHHKTCHTDYATSVGCMYRCKECGDTFKERFQLYKHAKGHIIKSDEKVCDVCGHAFAGSDALAKHRKEEHKLPENNMYRCKVCSYTSKDRKEIYLHVKNHTKRPEPTLHLCESCGCSFATSHSLNRHVLQHGKTKTLCNICNKHFIDSKALTNHMQRHAEMTMCEKCGQSVNSFKLELHNCV